MKESIYVDYQPASPVDSISYFIGIGVSQFKNPNLNLKYAVKDIRDLAKSFKAHNPNMIIDTLIDKNVTRENILKLKQKLLKTTVNDKVILAISGHGFLSDSLDFYYGTWDIDPSKPEEHGLSYDELEWLLDSIPARKKLVLMDACHSGEVDKDEITDTDNKSAMGNGVVARKGSKGVSVLQSDKSIGLQNSFELMQELFTNLSKGNGAFVISAAGGMQYAYEGEQWKNGVFSYAVMKGTKEGAADKNNDKIISVNELQDYVLNEVEKLTNGHQKPTVRQESLEADWRVW